MTRRFLAVALALACSATSAQAQSWPSKPVKVVVPITAGSAIDIVARATAQHLTKECPLWVKSRHPALELRCPLYPQ